MSGDVQPRKRRDKKRKKDEVTQEDPVIQHQAFPSNSDDFNIHVHKESSTGGGICAKIVFFCLFAILGVLIGLIIVEHRGLTDLEAVDTDSRFAKVFDGWTEPPGHDDHDEDPHGIIEEDHNDEHDEDGAHSEEVLEEEQSEEEEEGEVEASEEQEETDEELEEGVEEDEEEEEEDETTEVNASEDEEDETVGTEENEDEETTEKYDETSRDEEEEEDDEENISKNTSQEEDEGNASNDDNDTKEQYDDNNEEDDDDANDDDDDFTQEEEAEDIVKEKQSSPRSHEETKEPEVENIEKLENVEEGDITENSETEAVGNEDNTGEGAEDDTTEQATAGVAVKFGVGVALLVVAHVVLVRKWNPDSNKTAELPLEETAADLSRRKTIVAPPPLEQVEQHIENLYAEYSDEEYDEEEQESEEEESIEESDKNMESKQEPAIAKQQYNELRSTYTRSLTPESEPEDAEVEEVEEEEEEEEEEEDDAAEIPIDLNKYEYNVEEEEEADGEDDEEVEEEEEEISDNDDDDLLKKLEAKYGKIKDEGSNARYENQFEPWKKVKVGEKNDERSDFASEEGTLKADESRTGAQSVDYGNENITNTEDWLIRDKLDNAEEEIYKNVTNAVVLFDEILKKNPKSPRARYGKAQAWDKLANVKQSNELLLDAINAYISVLTSENVPVHLFRVSAERCINRMRFRGQYGRAIEIHKMLIKKFSDDGPKYSNQLAVTYLTINKLQDAKRVLHQTLLKWRRDGFAMVHYGFILKIFDNDLENAVSFMMEGINTKEPGVIDGRFYFHLGDALTRLGRNEEAIKVYKDGVANKVFPSLYQRSLYNVPRLSAKPWWNSKDIPPEFANFFETLRSNWKRIRDEGLALLDEKGYFKDESENLKDVGEWKQFELFARGVRSKENCDKCPVTCRIIGTFREASGCRRGQSKFSVMHPGTHVWPHCGPTNCRLRSHLGLKIPPGTFLRVAEETKSWREGEVILFDDSFEHEVWHNGTEVRLVLIVDVWHPELSMSEKTHLPAI